MARKPAPPRVVHSKLLPPRRLYCRAHAAYVLDTSISTIRRMEAAGKLTPVKLNAENGPTYYTAEEVHALCAQASTTEDEVAR